MKGYGFKVSYTVSVGCTLLAASEEEAREKLAKKYSFAPKFQCKLERIHDLEWFAKRANVSFGAYVHDEYQREYHNEEQIGPFETCEEAINAVRLQWQWGGDFYQTMDSAEFSSLSPDDSVEYIVYHKYRPENANKNEQQST